MRLQRKDIHMDTMLDKLRSNIITRFQISRDENLIVKKRISKGYSGAEVYLVELCGDSLYKGLYFLKIDTNRREMDNAVNDYRFSNVAKIVKCGEIESCCVMLIQVAGKSLIDYKAFYEIEPLSARVKATRAIVSGILREAAGADYMGNEEKPSLVFRSQLKYKLDENSELSKFVEEQIGNGVQGKAKVFSFKGYVLPNALAFALNDKFWEGRGLRNTKCAVHGDLHGNNVFCSGNSDEYALIDMGLYREDGYLFYDTAYFELSFLLEGIARMEPNIWMKQIRFISEEQWDDVEAGNRDCLREICDSEKRWINSQDDSTHAYHDFLKEAELTARVMAGLNYAGKMAVNKETREKSYFYACIYMEKLLNLKGIDFLTMNSIPWTGYTGGNTPTEEIETGKATVEKNELEKVLSLGTMSEQGLESFLPIKQ